MDAVERFCVLGVLICLFMLALICDYETGRNKKTIQEQESRIEELEEDVKMLMFKEGIEREVSRAGTL